jgi:hypothetical protein
MVDARELSAWFPAGPTRRDGNMSLSRFSLPLVVAIGLLLAIAGTLAPSDERAAPGSSAAPLAVALPEWLVIATVAALAAASLILLAMIAPRPRPRRKKGEEPHELQIPTKSPADSEMMSPGVPR